ncbi:MAG: TIGR01244 family sulfur transferase [Pseudomonadota bacterium]
MQPRKISESISVAEQIVPADLPAAAALGFRSVICNRPDGEGPDQPCFAEIAKAAEAEGLEARYVPVHATGIVDGDIEQFSGAFARLPHPVLAYCRSGMRSTSLWALDQARTLPVTEVLAKAASAGYDLSPMAQRLTDQAEAAVG